MIRFLQIILLIILFRYLWRIINKYWPKISDAEQPKKPKKNDLQKKLKIDKSNIEDAEFTELDD